MSPSSLRHFTYFTTISSRSRFTCQSSVRSSSSALRQTYETLLRLYPKAEKELLPLYPEQGDHIILHINLPDAKDGYGALEYSNGAFHHEIRGEEYWSKHKARPGVYDFS